MKIRKDIVLLIERLSKATNFDLALVGGSVRDMMHELEFKDLDFVILGMNWSSVSVGIEEYIERIEDLLDLEGATDIESFNAYEGSCNKGIDFVIKFTIDGNDCDIILYSGELASVEEVFKTFDMSLNQVAIYKGKLILSEHALHNKVKPTGKLITQNRFDKISRKYSTYDFSLVTPFVVKD